MNCEAGRPQRTLGGRDEPVHCGAGQAEEVEVASLALNVAAGDQRGASARAKSSASSRLAMIWASRSSRGVSTYAAWR